MSPTLDKPRYGETCNNCGLCCKLSLCPAAVLHFEFKIPPAPCPLLRDQGDGRFLCGLVLDEEEVGISVTAELLGVGMGCTMRDDDTTEDEVSDLTMRSILRNYMGD